MGRMTAEQYVVEMLIQEQIKVAKLFEEKVGLLKELEEEKKKGIEQKERYENLVNVISRYIKVSAPDFPDLITLNLWEFDGKEDFEFIKNLFEVTEVK